MRSLLTGIIAFGLFPAALGDSPSDIAQPDIVAATLPVWQPAGGEIIAFEVLRKGKPFGTHTVSFEKSENGTLEVVNDIDLQVKFGPITAYKYSHDSTEVWADGSLVELTGETRKEGKDLTVSVLSEDGQLDVSGTNFTGELSADLIPSSHWHSGEVFSDAILSSEGGQLLDIRVDNLGSETLTVSGQEIETTRFRVYSDLSFDLWYDETGRWVKCAFEARGQNIEYVLQELY
ncbi:MAG: DUF6134 family protein [Pseudomonadota bacterium]